MFNKEQLVVAFIAHSYCFSLLRLALQFCGARVQNCVSSVG